MPRTATPPLPVGSMLAHYRIEEKVGEGSMGTVYRAHDEGLDRTVAVKVLRSEASGMTVRIDRFFREARAAARISHPNLTHVYYVGGDGSYRFFAMEYVRGADLSAFVESHGRPSLERALDILIQAATGLAAAHEVGIVHRDVKPSNILVRPDGTVKITDFGLSKSIDADVKISQDDTVVGTPIYMSPEQCRSRDVDARTDIYCLGLTAWALLVGRPPYPGPSLGDVLHDQINTPLPSLTAERPDLPASLERTLARMCSKAPADRPASMHEVVELLEASRPRAVHAAPIVARGVAVVIDFVAALVAFGAIAFLLGHVTGQGLPDGVPSALLAVLFLGFTVVAEARHAVTLGKWFLNLEVRAADGSEASRRAMWLRGLLRFPATFVWATGLPALPVLLFLDLPLFVLGLAAIVGGLGVFYATKGRTLSDLLTRTRVVYRMPVDERPTS
ncbi:MAG: protein kinase [Planctomycetota bacterium]|nr:protein kinase [Planctomycetota bacterium]